VIACGFPIINLLFQRSVTLTEYFLSEDYSEQEVILTMDDYAKCIFADSYSSKQSFVGLVADASSIGANVAGLFLRWLLHWPWTSRAVNSNKSKNTFGDFFACSNTIT
jgi:hypothetical protein